MLKGKYNANTIGVITESEIMEDSPQFNVDERVILFLYQKPMFGDIAFGVGNDLYDCKLSKWKVCSMTME